MQELIDKLFVGNKRLWWLILGFLVVSAILMFSAISSMAFKSYGRGGSYLAPFLNRHMIFMFVGFAVILIISHIPYTYIRRLWVIFLPISFILICLVPILGKGSADEVNGAIRSITIAGIKFQPYEFVKFFMVLMLADRLAIHQSADKPMEWKEMLAIMGGMLIIFAIITKQNLSTALIVAAITFIMMLIGRVPTKMMMSTWGPMILLGVMGLTFLLFAPPSVLNSVPGRMNTHSNRLWGMIYDYTTPASEKTYEIMVDENGHDNAQILNSKVAIARGISPTGPGNSVQRAYLSLIFSDFIFAMIVEEYGIYGALIVIAMFCMLVYLALKTAYMCDSPYPSLLTIGLTVTIVLQAAINMAVATGLGPVTGQPMPLLSLGGTSMIITCAYLGLLLSASTAANPENIEENEVGTEPFNGGIDEGNAERTTEEDTIDENR